MSRAVVEIETALVEEISSILGKEASEVNANAPLHEMGVDSMSFVEILIFIENEFDLNLMESGLTKENFQTIHGLAACISEQ
jgi:acyl carrier protein